MQDFIVSFTDFIIGMLGFTVSTVSGQFVLVFVLVCIVLFGVIKFLC